MNKEDFVIILQVALFNFDGCDKAEIIDLNNYPENLVNVGIKLCEYLKGEINKRKNKNANTNNKTKTYD